MNEYVEIYTNSLNQIIGYSNYSLLVSLGNSKDPLNQIKLKNVIFAILLLMQLDLMEKVI